MTYCHQPWCSAGQLLLGFGLDHPRHTTRSWTHLFLGSRTVRNILKLAQTYQSPSSHQEPIQFSPEHKYSSSKHNTLWQGLLLLSYMMCEEQANGSSSELPSCQHSLMSSWILHWTSDKWKADERRGCVSGSVCWPQGRITEAEVDARVPKESWVSCDLLSPYQKAKVPNPGLCGSRWSPRQLVLAGPGERQMLARSHAPCTTALSSPCSQVLLRDTPSHIPQPPTGNNQIYVILEWKNRKELRAECTENSKQPFVMECY